MGLSFANKVTIGRILAVPFFTAALLYYDPAHGHMRHVALGVFLVAMISDVIDGYIARTRQQKTRAGAILDPLADKFLLISAFLCLYKVGSYFGDVRFPLWFVVTMISRDVILLLGSMIIYVVHGRLEITPSKWGKVTTFCQVFSILGVFWQWTFSPLVWYLTIAVTVISGLGYIRNGIKVINAGSS